MGPAARNRVAGYPVGVHQLVSDGRHVTYAHGYGVGDWPTSSSAPESHLCVRVGRRQPLKCGLPRRLTVRVEIAVAAISRRDPRSLVQPTIGCGVAMASQGR
jgi:hypothetical protein